MIFNLWCDHDYDNQVDLRVAKKIRLLENASKWHWSDIKWYVYRALRGPSCGYDASDPNGKDVSGKYRELLEVENRNAAAAPENVRNNEEAARSRFRDLWPLTSFDWIFKNVRHVGDKNDPSRDVFSRWPLIFCLRRHGKISGPKTRLPRPLTNKQRCGRTLFSFKSGAGEFQSTSVFSVARNLALGLSKLDFPSDRAIF